MAGQPRIDGDRMGSVRKQLQDRLQREAMGDAEYEKYVVSPVDRTFVLVMVAIGVIAVGIFVAIVWLGL